MSFLDPLKRLFSSGGSPAALHKRGMANAKRENWEGAIVDYTAVIDSAKATDELTAMARFNRALAYSQQGNHTAAVAEDGAAGQVVGELAIPAMGEVDRDLLEDRERRRRGNAVQGLARMDPGAGRRHAEREGEERAIQAGSAHGCAPGRGRPPNDPGGGAQTAARGWVGSGYWRVKVTRPTGRGAPSRTKYDDALRISGPRGCMSASRAR